MRSQSLNHVYCNPFCIQFPLCLSGWWFQPLWKTLVSWDDYSKYMETSNSCSKPPSRNLKTPIFPPISAPFAIKPHGSSLFPIRSVLPPWFSPWQSEVPRAQRCALRRPSGRRSRRRCRRRCPAASAPARWGDAATRRPRYGTTVKAAVDGMGWPPGGVGRRCHVASGYVKIEFLLKIFENGDLVRGFTHW